jgi:hypothetical protein
MSGSQLPPDLVTSESIARALHLRDILKNSNKFTEKILMFEGEHLFNAISIIISQPNMVKLHMLSIKAIIGCIEKWKKQIESKKSILTNGTEKGMLRLIEKLVFHIPKPKDLDDKVLKKYKRLLMPLVQTIFLITAESNSSELVRVGFQTIDLISNKFPSFIVNDIISDNVDRVERFKERILVAGESLISESNLIKFDELKNTLTNTLDVKQIFTDRIRNLWELKGATWDNATQRTIKRFLFSETPQHSFFELEKKEETSSIKQLAGALVSAWDARNDGPLALHTFQLFSSVAEMFFQLKLKGDIGTIINFNKSVHELPSDTNINTPLEVEIVRPWVEWDNNGDRSILIKAIVKPRD